MTKVQEDKMYKVSLGIAISIIISFLGIMTTLMFDFSRHLMSFEKANNDAHALLLQQYNNIDKFTHSVYQYEIKPNTEFRKKYQNKFN